MLERLFLWGIRRFVGGPGRSWLFTSLAVLGLKAVRSTVGRRELVDVGSIKPGQKIVIEHLEGSHKQQISEFKADRKAAKRAERDARRSAKAAKAAARAAAKAAKAEA